MTGARPGRKIVLLALLALLASSGCGRLGFEGADGGADAGALPTLCDWSRPFTFSEPTPMSEVNTVDDESELWLSPDELRAIWLSGPADGDEVLYQASRATRDVDFATPTVVDSELATERTSTLAYSTDRLRAYRSTRLLGADSFDLYVASRSEATEGFSEFQRLSFSTALSDWDVIESPSGLSLLWASQTNGAACDLFWARRDDLASEFGAAELLPVNSAEGDGNPSVTSDELTLVWNAEEDLYYSVRPDVDSEFGPRQPIPVVNSAAGETEPFVSADGCTLYFASDRPGSLGERDYYRASFEAR